MTIVCAAGRVTVAGTGEVRNTSKGTRYRHKEFAMRNHTIKVGQPLACVCCTTPCECAERNRNPVVDLEKQATQRTLPMRSSWTCATPSCETPRPNFTSLKMIPDWTVCKICITPLAQIGKRHFRGRLQLLPLETSRHSSSPALYSASKFESGSRTIQKPKQSPL